MTVERDTVCAAIEAHGVPDTALAEDLLIVEDVVDPVELTAGRYDGICTPIPYENRDGSQVRLLCRCQ